MDFNGYLLALGLGSIVFMLVMDLIKAALTWGGVL